MAFRLGSWLSICVTATVPGPKNGSLGRSTDNRSMPKIMRAAAVIALCPRSGLAAWLLLPCVVTLNNIRPRCPRMICKSLGSPRITQSGRMPSFSTNILSAAPS